MWAAVSYWQHEFFKPVKSNKKEMVRWRPRDELPFYSFASSVWFLTKFVVPNTTTHTKTHCWTGIKRFARARLPSEREITEPTRNQRDKKKYKKIYIFRCDAAPAHKAQNFCQSACPFLSGTARNPVLKNMSELEFVGVDTQCQKHT